MKKICFTFLILTATMLLCGCGKTKEIEVDTSSFETAEEVSSADEIQEGALPDEFVNDAPYLKDTTYSGGNSIPSSIFQMPFQKTDEYTPNKELTEAVGEDTIEQVRQTAEKFLDCIANKNYRDFTSKADTINTQISDLCEPCLFVPDVTLYEDINDYIEMVSDQFVDSESVIEAKLVTDNSLVYKDFGSAYVRGMIEFTVKDTKDMGAIEELLRVKDIQVGKKYRRMIEFRISGSKNSGFKVAEVLYTVEGNDKTQK